ncbi:hypothetical protein [Caulobacter sp. DWR1-3-2b1]|uniref:hypothetical protein n=1 Tax=Caulobacter sp. DWR1-3-2b1 TaxID=2804670 RepID=UPI003CF182C2
MARCVLAVAVAAGLLLCGPAQAADSVEAMMARTENLKLQGRKGESLLRPGYAVGEYIGGATVRTKAVSGGFNDSKVFSKDQMSADFTVSAPGFATPVTGSCAGGQGKIALGWITFDRDDLAFVCDYRRGETPIKAHLTLALSRGKAWPAWRRRSGRASFAMRGSSCGFAPSVSAACRSAAAAPWAMSSAATAWILAGSA